MPPGRRIERALSIDMNAIGCGTPAMLARLAGIGCLADYLPQFESVQADIFDHLPAIAGEIRRKVYQNPTGAGVPNY